MMEEQEDADERDRRLATTGQLEKSFLLFTAMMAAER